MTSRYEPEEIRRGERSGYVHISETGGERTGEKMVLSRDVAREMLSLVLMLTRATKRRPFSNPHDRKLRKANLRDRSLTEVGRGAKLEEV
jgi:hypothetical protein